MHKLTAAGLILLLASSSLAWYGQEVSMGNLNVRIEDIPEVTALEQSVPVHVSLENTGRSAISGSVHIRDLVDETRVVGEDKKPFTVEAGKQTSLEFAIAFGKGSYSALYPVHAYVDFTQDGQAMTAHAVRIVSTRFTPPDASSTQPTPMEPIVVPDAGALPLWRLRTHRVAWQFFDQPMRFKPVGWTGSDPESRASMSVTTMTRGESRWSISMHPPWAPRAGTIFCDYLLKLPDTKPLKLTFATAIRDHGPTEPPSDGVLFRVWAASGIAGENAQLLYEKFTDAKTWLPGEADLSQFVGRTILLRLESHPGPAKNTACDSSFWAEPNIVAGTQQQLTRTPLAQATAENVSVARRILGGQAKPDPRYHFLVGRPPEQTVVVIRPTAQGIVDGVISLVSQKAAVSFDGFAIDILEQPVLRPPTSVVFRQYEAKVENGRAVHVHRLAATGKPFDLTFTIWAEGDGLRIAWSAPERVSDFSLGPADQQAPVVYYGHGYRIVNPRPFRAGFGGHNLATSHIGCDFAGGMSVLQAVDVPPEFLEVNPASNRYALHTQNNGTLTLVPSMNGAFDCAIKYRPLYDKKPAPAVPRLAGRFCFDIWGGRYADIAERMAEMIRYGLTDAFLTVHVWQRWGYDYRLPDIWPPDPKLGTIDDMRRIGEVCRAQDIPWGLHDNYIDFYPDAEGYTYDHICFTRDGQPVKAWYNQSRDAQSYRWRPDRFMPFLQRNMKLINDGVAPTHYFVDVFTSMECVDFYDRQGNYHPSTETRQKWGEAFAYIRDYLGGNAPTTSEAGHDQLIGYLDGADCQHLALTDDPRRFANLVRCEDWEYVPWFDAVNHSRFILHGVGYSGRYESGRGREEHGINSDDYIANEILEGHALMVDARCWGRPAVRKYWLAQDVARNLALKEITNVQMADGNMHRQMVTWSNGTRVYVNRGQGDWTVNGHVLPQYGYLVQSDGLTSTIEKRGGVICESCVGPSGWYCNARTQDIEGKLGIQPRVENFRHLGGGRFTWDVVWDAPQPAPRNMTVFVHFYGQTSTRADRIAFQDDHRPTPPTNQWKGVVRYPRTISVPPDASGEYLVGFGIYDEVGRLVLSGREVPEVGGNSYWVGTLTVKREGDRITDVAFSPAPPVPAWRVNVQGLAVDFGFAVTNGAFRIQQTPQGLRLTPLPQSPPFDVTLRLGALGLANRQVRQVLALAADGATSNAAFTQKRDDITLKHDGQSSCYEILL